MTTLNASNLTLDDVHRLCGFQGQYNGSFTPLLFLEPITELEQQGSIPILQKYQAIRNRGYTNKACLRSVDVLVRAGGLSLYSPRLPV